MDINININLNNNLKKVKINIVLLSILLIAVVLRFYKIDFQGAWLDELHTLKEGDPNLTFKEFHEMIMWREGIPHFYFLIVRFFGEIFGHNLFSIRLVSCVCGVLAVYGMYLLGKSLINKQTGYIAALLLALHPIHIEYSQEGRSYVMITMFLIFSFYRLSLFLKNVNLKNAIYLGFFTGLITNAQPIAIVCVLSIYLILVLFFLMIKTNAERINFIKYTFISGITTLIVFYPVYQIVEKVSKATSFWVQKPNYDYTVYILEQLAGGSKALLIISLLSYIILITFYVKSLKEKKPFINNQKLINFTLAFVWVFFYFIFILIKSYGQTSLMLIRYIIPLTPGFVLAIALAISNFKNTIAKITLTCIVSFLLMYNLFFVKDYYNHRQKAQFNDLCQEVITLNPNQETVVSNWGWLLSFYLDRENNMKYVYEKTLDNHINDIKTNSIEQESFWYLDGNSRPYNVLPETEKYLSENFTLEKTIELHDCWARHYISKKVKTTENVILKLNQFSNAQFDGSGNLMFFENSKSISQKTVLEPAKYQLEITAMSFPQVKINDENAKFKVFVNSKFLGQIEASEEKLTTYNFDFVSDKVNTFQIEIEFINDFSTGEKDRNLQISKIHLKKIK
ncbi:glycosyltransferase family 39 protein [Flavobacterium sp.]|jgi:uncharacterized membrane protein|uniref:glycosyltransferase family 39 protein n=1 Tax=Flavobacterium sp. TaxID=239 RepID=UPI0037BEC8F8